MKQKIFLLFLTKYVCICLTYVLKYFEVRAGFFNNGNLQKSLYKPILKYILDRLRPTRLKVRHYP